MPLSASLEAPCPEAASDASGAPPKFESGFWGVWLPSAAGPPRKFEFSSLPREAERVSRAADKCDAPAGRNLGSIGTLYRGALSHRGALSVVGGPLLVLGVLPLLRVGTVGGLCGVDGSCVGLPFFCLVPVGHTFGQLSAM